MKRRFSYCDGILEAHRFLLQNHSNFFIIGQGLWAPWYVGNSMKDLDKDFGVERVIDTPVSECASTGAALGAALCGYKTLVVHPRVDFMILAVDQIVNQAAKWSHMFGGQASPSMTIRAIVNRGGEQGAQHSQALHSWFAHIPGLRVLMPSTPYDARDLLIASVLSNEPVLYIDDRWLYEEEADYIDISLQDLRKVRPQVLVEGRDVTIVASSYSTLLAKKAIDKLSLMGVSCELIDLRVINPLYTEVIEKSVEKTGRLVAIDGGWRTCGLAGEIIASVCSKISPAKLLSAPARITLPDAPAPTSRVLEDIYYPNEEQVVGLVKNMLGFDKTYEKNF